MTTFDENYKTKRNEIIEIRKEVEKADNFLSTYGKKLDNKTVEVIENLLIFNYLYL